jgi:hypothetical protein
MGLYNQHQPPLPPPDTEAASPGNPSNFRKRAVRWAAPVVLVGALGLGACGNGNGDALRVAAPSGFNGSDQHLYNQADEIARRSAGAGSDQHLYNQANEIARRGAR